MKKQLAEHIFNLVKHGHEVAVKDPYEEYIILKGINPDGTFYTTFFGDTVEDCKKNNVCGETWSIEDLQNYFTDEYEIVTEPPTRYKKGDLVDILPIAKEAPGFEERIKEAKEMVGQKGLEIQFCYSGGGRYYVYTKDKSDSWVFPYWCLAPHFKEESDDKMEEAMELLKKNGYKVIKE